MTKAQTLTLVNGAVSAHLPTDDRGLAYGDGLFETLVITRTAPCHWQLHMERLLRGCKQLRFNGDSQRLVEQLKADVSQLIKLSGLTDATLKIIVTRGSGPRGYGFQNDHPICRVCTITPRHSKQFQELQAKRQQDGIRLYACQLRLSEQPLLAGSKHLNRLEQVLARAEWGDDYEEGLLLNHRNEVVEAVMSNVFMVKNGRLSTPELFSAGVEGVMRQRVLTWAASHNVALDVRPIPVEELKQADHLFVTNSLIGAWPVREYAGRNYGLYPAMTSMYQWLQQDQEDSLIQFKGQSSYQIPNN